MSLYTRYKAARRGIGQPSLVGLLALCAALAWTPRAQAGLLTVHLGPPQIGSGGNNPVSIPPTNILDYEVEYITEKAWETSVAVAPGIFFGKRTSPAAAKWLYVGMGGGLALDANGSGPGGYADLGCNVGGKTFMFNAEIKQAVGFDFTHTQIISPYAVRIGMSFGF